eukprot:1195331-Prorocentrum_minimum.AAC.3
MSAQWKDAIAGSKPWKQSLVDGPALPPMHLPPMSVHSAVRAQEHRGGDSPGSLYRGENCCESPG